MNQNDSAGARAARLMSVLPIVAAVGFAAASSCCLAANTPEPAASSMRFGSRIVLFVSTERSDMPAMQEIERALREAFHSSKDPEIEFFPEYLDFARFPNEQQKANATHYLQARYAGRKIDLVIAATGFGLQFVLANRNELFPGAPIIFCAADARDVPNTKLPPDVTGIVGHFDIERTVRLIFSLQPNVHEIICVGGTAPFDRFWQEETRKVLNQIGGKVQVRWVTDKSLAETKALLANVSPSSAVFYISMLLDGAGHSMTATDAARDLCQASKAPVYGFTAHFLEAGTVGGALFDFAANGRKAADLSLKVLRGDWVPLGSPELEIQDPLAVNCVALQKWGIPESRVPPNAEKRYEAPTLWQTNRRLILGTSAIVALQTALIAGLIAQRLWRRKAESSLRESEMRFRTMADAAPMLIWLSGPNKACTYLNQPWLEFTGRNWSEEQDNGWSEGVHADDRAGCLQTYSRAFDAREPFTMEYRLRRHDGEYRWITDKGIPRYDTTGTFLGFVGACVDITDLLSQKQALHDSKERVALATEAAHLGIWELNPATNEIWLSDNACDLFRFDRGRSVRYDDFQMRVHPEDRESRHAVIQNVIKTCGGSDIEYRSILPDGSIRWISGRVRCIADENGKLHRVLGVSVDVTGRKQTEQLFQLAAEGAHMGIWDWDETTAELSWDGAMREIFDLSAEGKMTLQRFYDAVYPHDLELVKTVWRHAVESHLPYQLEFRVQRSNGAIGWVDARGRGYYDEKGKPLRMIGIVFDITDRKLAEQEARRRREQVDLLSRVNLLGEMTGSLAHELNQPLAAIVTNANAGIRFIDRGSCDPAQMREILSDVGDDGRRAHEIISNVRNMIKKGKAIRGPINLNDVVRNVTHMVHPDATANHCTVEMTLADHLPNVECDPTQIQQVLINLVGNAFDAMRDTPSSRRTVQITTGYNGDEMIAVGVRDHGAGFPMDAHEQLFEQFFTTKTEGLGLGLAIVRSIIEAHGGRIGAENVDGGGARFYFSLPAIKETS